MSARVTLGPPLRFLPLLRDRSDWPLTEGVVVGYEQTDEDDAGHRVIRAEEVREEKQ